MPLLTMVDLDRTATIFEEQRSYLFSIAYRLLGTVGDAEDLVQDAYLRWRNASDEQVRSPRAYLATIVVRLCLDHLRSARSRREVYVGPWLPEPLVTTGRADLTDTLELRESLSFAFLLMLEKLTPLERAVFVLREVFDFDYSEIAVTVDKSEANCRQVFHRAKRRIHEGEVRFEAPPDLLQELTEQFMRAATSGNLDQVVRLLADDVVHTPDGGGKVAAGTRPIVSPDRVARGMLGNLRKMPPDRAWIEEINGQPAIVATLHGRAYAVMLLEIRDGQIRRVYTVANPDKLADVARHSHLTLDEGPHQRDQVVGGG
jgi:RNA polymerase sigma-70 factor (ECF subfamily)